MSHINAKKQKFAEHGSRMLVNELETQKLILKTEFSDENDPNSVYSWLFIKPIDKNRIMETKYTSEDVVSITDNKLIVLKTSDDMEQIEIPLSENVQSNSSDNQAGHMLLDALTRAANDYAENNDDEGIVDDDDEFDIDHDTHNDHGDGVVLKGGQPEFSNATFHNCTINIFDAPYQSQVASTTKPLKLETEETSIRNINNNNNA